MSHRKELLSKRTFLFGAGSLALIGTACSQQPNTELPKPIEPTPLPLEYVIWTNLEPDEKIRRLQSERYPKLEGFNSDEELKKACAALVISRTKSPVSEDELIKKVQFASAEEFIKRVEEKQKATLSQREKKEELERRISVKTQDNTIVINRQLFDVLVDKKLQPDPDRTKYWDYSGRNITTIHEANMLVRSYLKLIAPSDEEDINVTVNDPYDTSIKTTFTHRQGLVFFGTRITKTGRDLVAVQGAEDAALELIAEQILPTSIHLFYSSQEFGADSIRNKSASSKQQGNEYVEKFGTNEFVPKLLEWWSQTMKNTNGQPDRYKALTALVGVGVMVDASSQNYDIKQY